MKIMKIFDNENDNGNKLCIKIWKQYINGAIGNNRKISKSIMKWNNGGGENNGENNKW